MYIPYGKNTIDEVFAAPSKMELRTLVSSVTPSPAAPNAFTFRTLFAVTSRYLGLLLVNKFGANPSYALPSNAALRFIAGMCAPLTKKVCPLAVVALVTRPKPQLSTMTWLPPASKILPVESSVMAVIVLKKPTFCSRNEVELSANSVVTMPLGVLAMMESTRMREPTPCPVDLGPPACD